MDTTKTSDIPGKKESSLFSSFSEDLSIVKLSIIIVCIITAQLAWTNRFIQDDAFISFRYAENFANGKGLVYNEGERVEGYTNFLWTMLMTIPHLLDIDVVTFSYGISLFVFLLNIFFIYRLALLVFGSSFLVLMTLLLLGTNYTFSSYATGGLETGLQTFSFLAGTFLVFRANRLGGWKWKDLLLLSLAFCIGLLTRLDFSVFILAISPILLLTIYKQPVSVSKKVLQLISLSLPILAIVGSWMAWKYSFYGDIVPNTFYVKASSQTQPSFGIGYFYSFLLSYWLLPVFFLFVAFSSQLAKKGHRPFAYMTFMICCWFLYILKIGGGFMEYRFIVPVMPFIFILIVWLIFQIIEQKTVRVILVIIILMGSFHHSLSFNKTTKFQSISSINELRNQVSSPWKNWATAGKVLGTLFQNTNDPVTIAVTAAGAIPYYSKLKTVDMLGLNDRWVARNGGLTKGRPGHQRIAPLEYLQKQGVHLVIGHPQTYSKAVCPTPLHNLEKLKLIWWRRGPHSLPQGSKFIEIPIEKGYTLEAIYLKQNPRIDEMIQLHQLETFDFIDTEGSQSAMWLANKCRHCVKKNPKSATDSCKTENLLMNF